MSTFRYLSRYLIMIEQYWNSQMVSKLYFLQDRLVLENFDIEERAGGAQKPTEVQFHNITVTNHVLEIRFSWAGKGTTRVPTRGVYGPLISAISVYSG